MKHSSQDHHCYAQKTRLKTNAQGRSTQHSSFVEEHKAKPWWYRPSLIDISCNAKEKKKMMVWSWTLIVFVLWSSFHFYSFTFLCSTKTKICIHGHAHARIESRYRKWMGHARFSLLCEHVDGHVWIASVFFQSVVDPAVLWKSVVIRYTCLRWWQMKCSAAKISQDILLSSTLQSQIPTPFLTPPCRTFTPRYQFCVITFLLSFWGIGPFWSFAICSSYLCLLWMNILQASTALYEGLEKRGRQSKAVIHWENLFWEDVKTTYHVSLESVSAGEELGFREAMEKVPKLHHYAMTSFRSTERKPTNFQGYPFPLWCGGSCHLATDVQWTL